MPQEPGHLVGKMLWLVPRYVEKHGAQMKLGSILSDPEDLESALNRDAIPDIKETARRDATMHVRQFVQTDLNNNNSLFAKLVLNLPQFSAGVSADGRRTHDVMTTVQAMDVKATVFIPDEDFMNMVLTHDAIIKYVRNTLFGAGLYVIVGVATANSLSVKEKQGCQAKAAAAAHVEAPGGAGYAAAGFEHDSKAAMETELEVGEACDFAYRIREFVYTRIGGLQDKGNRSKSAMFGEGSEEEEEEEDEDEEEGLPLFQRFEDGDVDLQELVALSIPDEFA